jgi:hypothetical protein
MNSNNYKTITTLKLKPTTIKVSFAMFVICLLLLTEIESARIQTNCGLTCYRQVSLFLLKVIRNVLKKLKSVIFG